MPTTNVLSSDYPVLRRKVEATLLQGQKKIEEAKVQTYWLTGKFINEHIKKNDSRAVNYGSRVIEKLSEDIQVSRDVLWRCSQFAKAFKILVAPRESPLTWTHYLKLITVHDEDARISLMKRAERSRWSSDLLAQKIDEEITQEPKRDAVEKPKASFSKLIPKKGELFTYRLIETDPLHKKYKDSLRIDVGFKLHQKLPDAVKTLKAGQIIESAKDDQDNYSVAASKRKESSLFTYKAYVERVVDGDTLYVDIDLGFKMSIFQYLRLRGINCPELDPSKEKLKKQEKDQLAPRAKGEAGASTIKYTGQQAKAFIERELAKVPYVILCSSRSDKYDRYLADVYYGEGEKEKYLNQVLLEEGFAERMG